MNDDERENGEEQESDDDERGALLPPMIGLAGAEGLAAPSGAPGAPPPPPLQHPLGAEAPASGSPPLQHSAAPQSGPAGPQHAPAGESAGHVPDQALQHSQTPQSTQTGAQHTQAPQSSPTGAQHAQGGESLGHTPDHALQHSQAPQSTHSGGQHSPLSESPPDAAQHVTDHSLQPGGDAAAQHGGLKPPRTRVRRVLERVAKRPRGAALIGSGVVAAVVATVAVVSATREPDRREVAAVDPSVEVVVTDPPAPTNTPATTPAPRPTSAPITAAPATTDAPTTTEQATTTTEGATTTTLPSGAGVYSVTTSGFTLNSPEVGFSQSFPGQTGSLSLVGACDGVGPCTAGFAETMIIAPNESVVPGGEGPFTAVVMTPNGAAGYTATLVIPIDDSCGDLDVTITLIVGGSGVSGAMDLSALGTGVDCPSLLWNFTFSGDRSS